MDHGVLEVVGDGLAGGAQPAGRVSGELTERAEDGFADVVRLARQRTTPDLPTTMTVGQ